MKKTVAYLILALSILCQTVYAAGIEIKPEKFQAEISYTDNSIEITGKGDFTSKENILSLTVTENGQLIYIADTDSFEDGNFKFSVDIGESSESRDFVVGIGGHAKNTEISLTYYGTSVKKSIVDELKNEDISEDEFLILFDESKEYFAIEESLLNGNDELKAQVINNLYLNRGDLSADNFKGMFIEACFYNIHKQNLYSYVSDVIFRNYDNYFETDFSEQGYYSTFDDDIKAEIFAEAAEAESFDKLDAIYNETIMIKAYKSVSRDKLDDYLEYYADKIDSDIMEKYNDADEEIKNKIIINVYGKSADSAEDIISIFETEINDATKPTEEKRPASSGSPGGSGGKGSTSIGIGMQIPAVKEETTQEIQPAELFNDLSEALWAEAQIKQLAEKNIISGYGDGSFRPNGSVTRAELCKMLTLALDLYSETAKCEFDDVLSESWAYSYIASLYERNIVNGISETEFAPDKIITRQELATMVCRAVEACKISLNFTQEYVEFKDEEQIANYAAGSVYQLQRAGIVNGFEDATFRPGNVCTRAMAAKVICDILAMR